MTHEEILAAAERFLKSLGDPQAMREALAADVVWHVPGKAPISGEHKGVEGVLSYFGKLRGLSDGTFHAKVVEVLTGGSTAALYSQATGKRPDGRRYDSTYVLLLTIRDGRVAQARLYNADQAAFERFWA
jgi:ketosteroid isomerase-like protein